ncbi:hypothetical protein J7E96_24855 [Streptomyces sp. ISL-96]|uniref:hypothetical protein n=1 Tax=Streptomyces sp. ISL-96 TaxID=2819191 RepID=UPI001BE9E3EF|nr:hypothetical protein [Streptomyces sp. ISL-96]MBT2491699.1 hypothetical protein [Streptomyces sp. ISL-96]
MSDTLRIPATGTKPTTGEIFGHACEQIHRAASELWPAVPVVLGEHVPSVTGYVHRIRVGDRELYAKHSMLGASLVSVLRGTYGNWDVVAERQDAYVADPASLLVRETAQLKFLSEAGQPLACVVAGLRRGVLFTEPVVGPTLAALILAAPGDTGDLLIQTWGELRPLHRGGSPAKAGVIEERSIAGTFRRKFNGLSGKTYIERLGEDRLPADVAAEVVALVQAVQARLRRLLSMAAPLERRVVFGDLKPEHVIYPDGSSRRPVFIDPGLMQARASVDAAKLISRTVLALAAEANPDAAPGIAFGLQNFTRYLVSDLDRPAREAALRELLALWCMDTVNIMTTYISAPQALPLPRQGLALIHAAGAVLRMVNDISQGLTTRSNVSTVWECALNTVSGAAT